MYLKLLLKALLNSLLRLFPLTNLFQTITSDLRSQLVDSIKSISCRHKMIVIDQFDEWFYFASFGNPFLAHSRGNFAGVALDSSDESVTEGMYFCSIVKWFEDDCLAACVTPTGDECNFSRFQD